MKALTTNILLEYLVEGNEKSKNADLFFNSASESDTYFLNNIVLSEVATFFEENVKFDKCDILKALRALESNSQIRFENREIVSEAIEMYSISRNSFSECLKSVINTGFQMKNLNLQRKKKKAVSIR
jgi:predicted nucleic-acid-binding protein